MALASCNTITGKTDAERGADPEPDVRRHDDHHAADDDRDRAAARPRSETTYRRPRRPQIPTTVAVTTTTEPIALQELILTGDGLGSAQFGADPDQVVEYVSSILGASTADTGWVDPFTFAACEGTVARRGRLGRAVVAVHRPLAGRQRTPSLHRLRVRTRRTDR